MTENEKDAFDKQFLSWTTRHHVAINLIQSRLDDLLMECSDLCVEPEIIVLMLLNNIDQIQGQFEEVKALRPTLDRYVGLLTTERLNLLRPSKFMEQENCAYR